MSIVIVGTNGLVGIEFIKLISEDYKFNDFIFVGSEKSKGLIFNFREKEYTIKTLDEIDYSKNYIFINCADKQQAIFIKENMNENSIMIDNSSQYRMDKKYPLVIPEINMPNEKHQIYANPNCSTIILDLLLKPLEDIYGIRRVVVSTYQAASGAGKVGLEELVQQTSEINNNCELTTSYWGKQYVYNTFVHNTPINSENNYNEEENKIMNETNKIFNKKIPVSATAIRVPVLRSHCESVNIELVNKAYYEEIINTLSRCDYLEIIDNKSERKFPESITSNNQFKVQVGHIREDPSLESGHGWNFWISADQLLRGAAYNAYLILKKLSI